MSVRRGTAVEALGPGRTAMIDVRKGIRFSSTVTLTPAFVADQARAAGDSNPLHHDREYAASSRFGRLIASGTQTSGLLMGLTPAFFARDGGMVGLEFWFRFRRAVFADETVRLEWLIIRTRRSERPAGMVVELRGRVVNANGETAVGAKGTILLPDSI